MSANQSVAVKVVNYWLFKLIRLSIGCRTKHAFGIVDLLDSHFLRAIALHRSKTVVLVSKRQPIILIDARSQRIGDANGRSRIECVIKIRPLTPLLLHYCAKVFLGKSVVRKGCLQQGHASDWRSSRIRCGRRHHTPAKAMADQMNGFDRRRKSVEKRALRHFADRARAGFHFKGGRVVQEVEGGVEEACKDVFRSDDVVQSEF